MVDIKIIHHSTNKKMNIEHQEEYVNIWQKHKFQINEMRIKKTD